MHQSKLIELLSKLSSRQLSRYEDFLLSPFFNKHQDNVLFFNYLKKYAPAFEHKNLSKEMALKKLKVSKPLDEKSLAYLMSQQIALLEIFLAVEQFLSNDFGKNLSLLEQLHHLQLPKHYKSAHDKTGKSLTNLPHRNAGYFQKQLIFKSLLYEQSDPNQHHFKEQLQDASDSLDIHFLVEKLRYTCEMVNLSTMLNISYRMDFVEEILRWSASSGFEQIPAILVYREMLLLLKLPDDTSSFSKVKNFLTHHEKIFATNECKQLYTLLLNYCARRINRFNDENFLREYLEINKLLLANELIFENGLLQPWRYANLVTVGLKTGQMDWTRNFIHQFKNRLPEEYAENMFRYNLAHFHYHQKDLDKAQMALLHVDFAEDVLLNVSARSLLVKIYYETDQTELLISWLEATRIFLHRNQLLDAQLKRQLQKFVEVTSKMARYGKPEANRLQELLDNLPPATEIMHRDWVSEQLSKKLMTPDMGVRK